MTVLLQGITLVLVSFLMEAVGGLKLTELLGPRHADRGGEARLTCKFDTGNAKLYSVKWYKDDNEFFRYMPENRPSSQLFPQEGVTLDESSSGIDHVTLTDLTFSSSGSYRCEVSTEAPNFETTLMSLNMTVYAYPHHNPKLSGMQETYSLYDQVTANCTAAPSIPRPYLRWYINNLEADDYLVDRTPALQLPDETYTTSASLKFAAQRQHFHGGVLIVRCDAEAAPLDTVSTSAEARLVGALTNEKLAQEFGNSGVHLAAARISLLLVTSLALIT